MGDESDRQIGVKRKRILFTETAEEQTVGGGNDANSGGKDKEHVSR